MSHRRTGSAAPFVLRTLAAGLLCWCALSGAARAQSLPAWLRVDSRFLAELEAPAPSAPAHDPTKLALSHATQPKVPSLTSRAHQERARRLVAAGTGFVLSAAIAPSYILTHREPCYGSDQQKGRGPLIIAAGVGAVGSAALIGGATWLVLESSRHGPTTSRWQRVSATGIGALTFVLSQALLGTFFLADQLC